MKTLTITLPSDFELAVTTTSEELEAQVRLMAALKMFDRASCLPARLRVGGHVARRVLRDVRPVPVSIFNYSPKTLKVTPKGRRDPRQGAR